MMKKNYALLLMVCLLALCPQLALAQESTEARIRRSDAAVPGKYIVVFKDSVPAGRVNAFAAQLAREHGGKVGFVYQHALRGFSVELSEARAIALSRNPQVEYVE
ncbi:MAG TPA: protease inhibitor I9 family protein, partial [Pyrinomonadaceae bacterium]|nr:protease inhibitor I9 family protein [Pyrinomonadaceae bacterium]